MMSDHAPPIEHAPSPTPSEDTPHEHLLEPFSRYLPELEALQQTPVFLAYAASCQPEGLVAMATPDERANEEQMPLFTHFGEVLRYARTSSGRRMFHLPAGVAPPELTARRLIATLAEHDYPLSSASFSNLEAGSSLPRDPERFLRALFVALALSPEDELGRLLILFLARDILRRDLGKYTSLLNEMLPEES